MARHRRHYKREDGRRVENTQSSGGLDLSNLAGIANLLGSIDINKITTILGSLNNNINNSQRNDTESVERKNEIAKALSTIINCDKSELLQVALQFYVANKNNQSNISNDSQ